MSRKTYKSRRSIYKETNTDTRAVNHVFTSICTYMFTLFFIPYSIYLSWESELNIFENIHNIVFYTKSTKHLIPFIILLKIITMSGQSNIIF